MTDNNIEKTISCDGSDNDAHILVSKHSLEYFKFLLDKILKSPYFRKDLTEHHDNGK